jgi:hypothetical protein
MKLIFTDGYEQREFNNQIKLDFNSFELPFLWSGVIAALLKIGLLIICNITIHEFFQSGGYKIVDCKNSDSRVSFKGTGLIHYTHETFRYTLLPFLVYCNIGLVQPETFVTYKYIIMNRIKK